MSVPLRQYWDLLGGYFKTQKRRFLLLVLQMLSSIGLQIVNPQIVRAFLDAATTGAALQLLLGTALAFLAMSLSQQAVSVAATYVARTSPGPPPTNCGPTWCATACIWTWAFTTSAPPASRSNASTAT